MWGTNGLRSGEFVRPRAICEDRGDVFVIDITGRVQVFGADGTYRRSWSLPDHQKGTPTGITLGVDDRVLIPDTHYSRILEYSRNGKLLCSWGSYGSGPERFIYPTGIAQSGSGHYFVSEYGINAEQVRVFDEKRRQVRRWGSHGLEPGMFNRAMALAFHEEAGLYVADTANHRVQRFDRDGTLLGILGRGVDEPGTLKFPHDVAIAPDQTVFVAEYGAHRISRYSMDGSFVGSYGGPGRGPGQFNGPRGVSASAAGAVFVADTDNHRVQRFKPGPMG